MSIAAQADPEAAAIEYRERAAEHQRAYRERHKTLPLTPPSREREPEPEPDDYEPDPEPEIEPPRPPFRPSAPELARDPLAEAAALKTQIIGLMRLMRPIEREQFKMALLEDLLALERETPERA